MKHAQTKKTTKADHVAPHEAAPANVKAVLPVAPKRLRIPDRHIVGFNTVEIEQVQEVAVIEPLPSHEGKVIVPPSVKKRSKKHGKKS